VFFDTLINKINDAIFFSSMGLRGGFMPIMITWTERKYFSLQHDAHVSRVSGFDDKHLEFWMVIDTGKGYRDRRTAALERIMEVIADGKLPWEVKK
jgi:hypothetical protein